MAFAYLRDPLFAVCFAAYWAQRVLRAHELSPPLCSAYLNDLICIPFWAPIMLWTLRGLDLRSHDNPPRTSEVVIPLLIWSAVFEIVLPLSPWWASAAVADPYDIVCYCLGALLATRFWNWWYCDRGASASPSYSTTTSARPQ